MAFKKTLAQRIFNLTNCRISLPSTIVKSSSNKQSPPNKLAQDPGDDGIFRRHLHRQSAATPPVLLFVPHLNDSPAKGAVTVADVKKILMFSQLERVKLRLRQIENDCVSYLEFLKICCDDCSSVDEGVTFAKMLDESGNVIVLGNNVFLRPQQVLKAIGGLIPFPLAQNSINPKMKEFQEMEKQKASIDKKASLQVRRELQFGLFYLFVQTTAFMRLTFWDLTWDVMEPICFYVTSSYVIGCYAFFLRTSKEPSFQGFYESRFSAKQKRLMRVHNFDVERYYELKKTCCPYN